MVINTKVKINRRERGLGSRGMIILERMPRKIVLRRCSESRDPQKWGNKLCTSGEGGFQAEGASGAKVLRQHHAWYTPAPARRAVWPPHYSRSRLTRDKGRELGGEGVGRRYGSWRALHRAFGFYCEWESSSFISVSIWISLVADLRKVCGGWDRSRDTS